MKLFKNICIKLYFKRSFKTKCKNTLSMSYYQDYVSTRNYGEAMENSKRPGQQFCDKFNWKLDSKYKVIQRPDKVTFMNGSIYRTITPTTHIWYQSKNKPEFNVWVEFDGSSIVVKEGIRVRIENCGFKQLMYPESDKYKSKTYFHNDESAFSYIFRLI